MSGGIVQLVATGPQDVWLTGNPEVSFYRSTYKRYTHYAMSLERQIIQGVTGSGNISTIRFEKKGDLMNYVYFVAKDTSGALIPGIDWSKVVDRVELLIGGQVIDTQDITWMTQIEPVTGAQNYSQRYLNNNTDGLTNVINGFLPLKFFFCKDWTSSLPLVALAYHDIEIRITWSSNMTQRVSYALYTVANPATTPIPNLATTTAITNPVTGTAVATSTGAMQMTISNTTLSTVYAQQSNPFTYTGANFQLVPGMNFYTRVGGATILGAPFLTVVSVSPATNTSGTFIGVFSLGAPNAASLTATVVSPNATPYSTTVATLGTGSVVGSVGAITLATAPGAGVTQAFTSVTAIGYITPGMSTAVNLPGTTSTGYVTAIGVTSGAINAVTIGYAASTTATTISSGVYGFNPAVSQAARLTYANDASGITAAVKYNVDKIGGGGSNIINGQIFVGMAVPLTGMPAGTTGTGYVTTVTPTGAFVTQIVVTYAGNQNVTSTTPVDVTLTPPGDATITSATYNSTATNTTVYTSAILPAGSYLVPGMSISGLASTTGTGYITAINSTQPGQQNGFSVYYPAAAPTITANLGVQIALAPVGTQQSTVVGQTVYNNVPIYGVGGLAGAVALPVNSVLTSTAPTGTGATVFTITDIVYRSPGVALAQLTLAGAPSNGAPTVPTITVSPLLTSVAVQFTPTYPIVNLLTSVPTGTMVTGATILGGTLGNTPLASVSTIYGPVTGGYLVSIKMNQQQTAGLPASTPDGYYSTKSLSFVPSIYYCGVVTSTPVAFSTSGGSLGSLTIAQGTIGGVATSTAIPRIASYFYTTPASTGVATVATNPVVNASSASAVTVNYTAATLTTAFSQYTQFAVIPQGQIVSQLAGPQPYIDREGSAIISLNYVSGVSQIQVGMAVMGTQYTGPVTVSRIVTSSGTIAGDVASTAIIEISFPVQSQIVNATTGSSTFIQFIDPTQPLGPGVTVSTTGFNGTYEQLQYEVWTNFVILDQNERNFFAKNSFDMLITQINRIPILAQNMQDLSLNHPVKFIAFLANNYTTAYQTQLTTGIPAVNYQFKTQANGVDIGDSKSLFQWQDIPQYYFTPYGYQHNGAVAPVGLISYCLDTAKLQPTGSLNFSRMDSYRLVAPIGVPLTQISGAQGNYFYAMNYNVLRIKDGMSGMLYGN